MKHVAAIAHGCQSTNSEWAVPELYGYGKLEMLVWLKHRTWIDRLNGVPNALTLKHCGVHYDGTKHRTELLNNSVQVETKNKCWQRGNHDVCRMQRCILRHDFLCVNIATWCDPESTQRVCREKSWFCNSACRSSWSKFHPVEYQNVFKSSKHIQYECSYLYPCHCPLLRAQLEHCTLYVRLRRTLISLENDTWTTNDSYWIALWE